MNETSGAAVLWNITHLGCLLKLKEKELKYETPQTGEYKYWLVNNEK